MLKIFGLGIILEYEQQNVLKTKSIDLLDLKPKFVLNYFLNEKLFKLFTSSTNVEEVVEEISKKEPLITNSRKEQVAQLVLSIFFAIGAK